MTHIESYWQTLTVSSNSLFDDGDFKQALSGYKEALYRAEVLNNNISKCLSLKIPFIQVYIISCNNLANTYIALGKDEKAEKMLKRSVHFILHLTNNRNLNKIELQAELKKAALAYMHFVAKLDSGNLKQKEFHQRLQKELLEKK